jgi:hypothetical protein
MLILQSVYICYTKFWNKYSNIYNFERHTKVIAETSTDEDL